MWGTLNIEGLITEAAPKGPFGQPSMFRFVYVLCVQSFFKGIPVRASTGSIREGCKVSPALHAVGMPGCGCRRQRFTGFWLGSALILDFGASVFPGVHGNEHEWCGFPAYPVCYKVSSFMMI